MIPVKLTIEGLYSYQERQTIDFSKLTEAGLFGIFGAVGSGKSSILESISFALYGETERLNQRDKRAYNMMNLKSNRFYIEFDFINHENKLFRATREFKRNSKRFDDVKPQSSVFYEYKNEEWIPLNHMNAELVLGLSYDNFKRTMIIPQGQFKEFLELGAKDRTDMMKEIFDLDRFDLHYKVGSLSKENQTKIDQLTGKLSGFEEITSENIEVKREEVGIHKELLIVIEEEHDKNEIEFQNLSRIKSDFETLAQKKKEFQSLENQKEEFDKKKKEVEEFEKIHSLFYLNLLEQKKLNKEIENNKSVLENQKKDLGKTQSGIENYRLELEKIKEDFEALSNKRNQESDMELLIQILQFKKEEESLNERLLVGENFLEEVIKKQKFLIQNIRETELKIDEINKNKFSSDIILGAGNWFLELTQVNQSAESMRNELSQLNHKFDELKLSLKEFSITEKNFEEEFNEIIEEINKRKNDFENHRNHLNVQEKLAHYSDALHDGESCPLCGSLDHPNIAEISDVSDQLKEVNLSIEKLNNSKEKTEKDRSEVRGIHSEIAFYGKKISEQKENLLKLQNQVEIHQQKFKWKEFNSSNPEDFALKKERNSNLEKEILRKNDFIKQNRNALDLENSQFQKSTQKLEKLKIEKAEKSSSIKQNLSRLKVLDFLDFENYDSETLNHEWIQLKTFNDYVEEKNTVLNKALNELNPKLASQKTTVEISENELLKNQNALSNLNKTINALIKEQNISSIEWVQQILDLGLNVNLIRKEIEDFRIQYKTSYNSILELSEKVKGSSFDQTSFELKEKELKELKTKLKDAVEIETKLKTTLERLEKEFKIKKDLLLEKEKLDSRAENLKTLTNLFKASGFVQYVSSIYLRQLCDLANDRFHRMTRNQLSLQLNENNDFEIIDYLNEGRSRSVKTLSGGQSFQVSLSLALALAESVQSNAMAEKNFFFIDEGFGTQDVESVNVVFETLMNLQKENRIVGIISHVEELKEKIPITLNIVKDEEKGSLIEWING